MKRIPLLVFFFLLFASFGLSASASGNYESNLSVRANHSPVIYAPGYGSTTAGTLFEMSVVITDADGDILEITTSLPEGSHYSTST